MQTLTCGWCNRQFRRSQSRKFCSPLCKAHSLGTALVLTCEECGRQFERRYTQRFCGVPCASLANGRKMRGENHPTYKGRLLMDTGYVRVRKPGHPLAHKDGYILEHRLVLDEAGIQVPKGSHVHHRNGDKTDNRLSNLEVLSAKGHKHRHLPVGALVANQYGTYRVRTNEEKRRLSKGRSAAWREKNPERVRQYREEYKERAGRDALGRDE